ncbi:MULTISPECIES: hydroxyethylthiazole kinase [unclassified Breznakia]|uniref:hydroxyethylthiazole kinase n=1 Tax=unclassified Breznakia TaxID=2623764 RepID=UPI002476B1AF|nr:MULTISPECIES: hydroxyethylthiazole kinase [unclassified Breznakia]MDH6367364.1 hydroxyethylthiazole kinase [Breznakia sp. PH1-1]MDH6404488.1 hydroxyethylthiazole kinase [Breznakia sp. PF1-11]MDH6412197.1 hydroxyethylthiazole kinase [Breznakia sp. PFB1-11]MDH6414531.1 hydroxyethylthiazole kinase [Breznakia sp. PFB1-14]MDH6416861.1 hydroxyethylthiazole kinase [Breznakia sp. PFB1-4]
MMNKIQYALEQVRQKRPLVHHLTNYVTVNDCANITLATGGSPVMADAIEEVKDMASIASSVVLNMGTLNKRTLASMITAGKTANQKGIPVVFDPVGVGATRYRNESALEILSKVTCDVIRGNASELRFLLERKSETNGVDAVINAHDYDIQTMVVNLANTFHCVVACTGAIDIISDGKKVIKIYNGHIQMSAITGTGCMCTSLIGAYCGANDDTFIATCGALISMGIAGELAYEKAKQQGHGHFHMGILDEIGKLDAQTIAQKAKYDETEY